MNKMFFALSLLTPLFSCQAQLAEVEHIPVNQEWIKHYMNVIQEDSLKNNLYTFAGDQMQGREAGTQGQYDAVMFLVNKYADMGVMPGIELNYLQEIPAETFKRVEGATQNVLAFIEGSEKPEEIVVVSAHLDHLGIKGEEVYNGADDDGSGSMALLEIARAFQTAKNEGKGPKRSILFLHATAEEKGLLGSKYYVEHPVYPLENTVANVNIDMIGRVDEEHEADTNYIYVIGADMLSSDLNAMTIQANDQFGEMELDYRYSDKKDPNRFYYRSDHYNFAKNNIPAVFYFNGTHADYHKLTDTPDKIDYSLLTKRTRLIFATTWLIANAENRPVVDGSNE